MKISMIAAIGEDNRVLGKDNKLLWNIPEDTHFFRDTTRGHTVIMGRKTFESLGKPLPNRTNIVITREKDFHPEEVIVCHTIEEAIARAKEVPSSSERSESRSSDENSSQLRSNKNNESNVEIFVIGGGQIYTASLPHVDRLYLTIVHQHFEGDAFFPDYSEFTKIISQRESEGNGYHYTFLTLER